MALPLTTKTGLFGDDYHTKKEFGMPDNKAIVAVMRKLLKMIWGLSQTSAHFEPDCVHISLQDYEKLTA